MTVSTDGVAGGADGWFVVLVVLAGRWPVGGGCGVGIFVGDGVRVWVSGGREGEREGCEDG